MQLPVFWGYLLFFAVPIVLWLVGAFAVKRRPLIVRLLSIIAGNDNRLSLSRAQAFAWTLVIFGSFAAAMSVHSHISMGSAIEARQRTDAAKRIFANAQDDLKISNAELADAKKRLDAATDVWTSADDKAIHSRLFVTSVNGADKAAAEKRADDDKSAAGTLKDQRDDLEKSYMAKLSARDHAQEELNKAEIAVNSNTTDWVQIPNTLLALAGIAIGSGVFSSLIAGANSDSKTACVISLKVVSPADLKGLFTDVNVQASYQPMIIEGENLGTSGRVRAGKLVLPLLYWSKDGKAIAVDISVLKISELKTEPLSTNIVIETANGKLAYGMIVDANGPLLGLPVFVYDLADLFRDDKDPSVFSLMKFQMFGWTVVAIGIYSWIFLTNLSPQVSALPAVDQSIVLLTGLSQGGYLAGKAASNVGNPSSATQPDGK
jgi:hypothetical protein